MSKPLTKFNEVVCLVVCLSAANLTYFWSDRHNIISTHLWLYLQGPQVVAVITITENSILLTDPVVKLSLLFFHQYSSFYQYMLQHSKRHLGNKNKACIVYCRPHIELWCGSKPEIHMNVWFNPEPEHLQIHFIPNMLWFTKVRHNTRLTNPHFVIFATLLTVREPEGTIKRDSALLCFCYPWASDCYIMGSLPEYTWGHIKMR